MATDEARSVAVSGGVTEIVQIAHPGIVIGGLVVFLAMLSPPAVRRRRAACARCLSWQPFQRHQPQFIAYTAREIGGP